MLTPGNFSLESGSGVSVTSTLTVSGDLVLHSDSALDLDGASSLLVGGCVLASGGRVVFHADAGAEAGRDYEVDIGQQGVDCGDTLLDDVVVHSDDSCLEADTGRLNARASRLTLVYRFRNICGLSKAEPAALLAATLALIGLGF